MDPRTIPRLTFGNLLDATRWPAARAARFVGRGGGRGRRTGAELAIDRADAAVRSAVGRAMGDHELRRDGARRAAAAEERRRALTSRRYAGASAGAGRS